MTCSVEHDLHYIILHGPTPVSFITCYRSPAREKQNTLSFAKACQAVQNHALS